MVSARYRCCFCGSFRGNAKDTRNHIVIKHRKALLGFLNIIESYGNHKPLDPPRIASKGHPPCIHDSVRGVFPGDSHLTCIDCGAKLESLNPGVSGEGDSS